jgi:hypothetical protein
MSVPFWVKSEVTSDGEWLAVWRSACFVVDRSIFAAELSCLKGARLAWGGPVGSAHRLEVSRGLRIDERSQLGSSVVWI